VNDLLTRTIALACPVGHAFDVFTRHVDLWWPRAHRRTTEATMVLEPVLGGRLLERAPNGEEWVIGRLTRFERPEALGFDWFPGSPLAPTAVTIAFAGSATGTEIRIVHRAISEGALAAWPDKVALFARGWDTILPALEAFIKTTPGEID
jgi:hypothetical protein